jgi:hypothetical protein
LNPKNQDEQDPVDPGKIKIELGTPGFRDFV